MKILNQGTEFDTLAETATRDRYEQLANLMTTMGEKGELPLAVALANVVPSNEQDDLAQVLVTLFDAMDLLYQFLWNILSQEVQLDNIPIKAVFHCSRFAQKNQSRGHAKKVKCSSTSKRVRAHKSRHKTLRLDTYSKS